MKRLFYFALLLASAAQADTLGLHVGSHHWPNEGKNNVNPGIYYRADNGFTAGGYCNSHAKVRQCKPSLYAGWSWETEPIVFGIRAAVSAVLVTGYDAAPVLPTIIPSVSGPIAQGWHWRVSGMPKVHETQESAVVHFSLERRF
jgi:hypothetical protein